jgi:hypothetical protein
MRGSVLSLRFELMDRNAAHAYFNAPQGLAGLWGGVLLGPLAWLLQLGVLHLLLASLCEGGPRAVFQLASGAALLLALSGLDLAWRHRRLALAAPLQDDDGTIARSRFIAGCGLILSLFFTLAVITLWMPLLLFDPCRA